MLNYSKETLFNLLADGWTQKQIAESYFYSSQKVCNDIKLYKIRWREVKKLHRARLAKEIQNLIDEGYTIPEIAAKFNVSESKVYNIKAEFKIVSPRKGRRKR